MRYRVIKMRQEMVTSAFAVAMILLFIWRIKGGYASGMMQEIVNILSGVVALVCVALVFLAVSSAASKSGHTLAACIIALIFLGIAFKVCNLILKPLLAVSNIFLVSGINKLLGAVLGALEAGLLAYVFYKVLIYLEIQVF